jgi:hypothetical protein
VRLGFVVGNGFPSTAPSGPHVSPRILPLKPGGQHHPDEGINDSPFGADWEYWSRPFHEWNQTDHSVKAYMNKHIFKLFETQ